MTSYMTSYRTGCYLVTPTSVSTLCRVQPLKPTPASVSFIYNYWSPHRPQYPSNIILISYASTSLIPISDSVTEAHTGLSSLPLSIDIIQFWSITIRYINSFDSTECFLTSNPTSYSVGVRQLQEWSSPTSSSVSQFRAHAGLSISSDLVGQASPDSWLGAGPNVDVFDTSILRHARAII